MATATPDINRTRYARQAFVVVDVFPEMMRALATSIMDPSKMCQTYQSDPTLKGKLSYDEQNILPSLLTDGYSKCDTNLLYKLVRKFLPTPGLGWGRAPLASNMAIGDDVERIRIARNHLLHRPNAQITEAEELKFFQDFIVVGRRFDLYLKHNRVIPFEQEISDLQHRPVDNDLAAKYKLLADEIEGLKKKRSDKTGRNTTNIYFGKEVDRLIGSSESDSTAEETENMVIVLSGITNEDEIRRVIKSLRRDPANENYSITVNRVTQGSIIIHVAVKRQILESEAIFCQELVDFLKRIFSWAAVGEVSTDGKEEIDAVILLDEEIQNDTPSYAGAQIPVKVHLPYSAVFKQQIKIPNNPEIRDCIITNNQLVFIDYNNNRLIIYRQDDTHRVITVPGDPCGVTEIETGKVAVSLPQQQKIITVNIITGEITNDMKTSDRCRGISYSDGLLYVVVRWKGIDVMDLKGQVIRTLPLPSNNVFYIKVHKDVLYYTDHSKLYCRDLQGDVLWSLKHDSISEFSGITTDGDGNIYVAGYYTNNIIVVSPDGQHHRELVTDSVEMDQPCAIFYDKQSDSLLVCNEWDGNAFVFSLQKKGYDKNNRQCKK